MVFLLHPDPPETAAAVLMTAHCLLKQSRIYQNLTSDLFGNASNELFSARGKRPIFRSGLVLPELKVLILWIWIPNVSGPWLDV